MSNKRNPGPVPPRWLHCPRKSEGLIVGKFMALKTPLSSDFDDQVPLECRFPPNMMFKYAKRDRIQFGLWIDLTNTTRFYRKSEIEEHDCKYVKLQCRGHGETPSKQQTTIFNNIVHKFILQNPLHSIAVHCTHGFNRTGFLIVSYLIERMDYSLTKALDLFAESRPSGIYKDDYMKELYLRYDDIADAPGPPALPDWCLEEYESEDDFDDPKEDVASTSLEPIGGFPKAKRRRNRGTPKFMAGVPGVHPYQQEPKASELQYKVQKMCNWDRKSFAGSQPVSMDVKNIELLNKKPYRVSWKADGMRYMMLVDGENEIYFFDRDNNVFKVDNLRFVRRENIGVHLKDTLLDGEMVIDKVNGENVPRYLVYDIVAFKAKAARKWDFYPDRMKCLENEIIQPRYMAMEKGFINKSLEPFSVRKKDFWPISQAGNLLGEKFAKNLLHEPDGLIFQPSKEPYKAGSCPEVLKWKPLDMNSVDFKLKIVMIDGKGLLRTKKCFLYASNKKEPISEMKYRKELKDLDNKIIECKFEDNEWKFMRERTDKSFANSCETAYAVGNSISNPVTKEMLLDYIAKYGFNDDSEMMPPPRKIAKR